MTNVQSPMANDKAARGFMGRVLFVYGRCFDCRPRPSASPSSSALRCAQHDKSCANGSSFVIRTSLGFRHSSFVIPAQDELAAYLVSLACLRRASKSLLMAIWFALAASQAGNAPPLSVYIMYVALVMLPAAGSTSQLPSLIFTRRTSVFSAGPRSLAGSQWQR